MKLHLWDFAPRRSSMCNAALYTDRMTGSPTAATCAKCYLEYLRRLGASRA